MQNVTYIGVLATGYNIVDVAAAKARGIVVTNIPTYGTAAVSQLVFAHILAYCHHVSEHAAAVVDGAWCRCPDNSFWNYPLVELADKTLGIIGFGRIGASGGAHRRGVRHEGFGVRRVHKRKRQGIWYVRRAGRAFGVVGLHIAELPASSVYGRHYLQGDDAVNNLEAFLKNAPENEVGV